MHNSPTAHPRNPIPTREDSKSNAQRAFDPNPETR
ncbi:MAG: hypothetical protein RL354_233, partial [Planctomycetota bacterium]